MKTGRLSPTELADRLGLSSRQITNLANQGVLEKKVASGRPYFEWPKSRDDYIAYKVSLAVSAQGKAADYEESKARKEAALAEKAEIEVAQLRGELIPLELHEQRVEALCVRLAGPVKGLSRYIADVQRAGSSVEASAVLDRISDGLLRALQGEADGIEADVPEDVDLAA